MERFHWTTPTLDDRDIIFNAAEAAGANESGASFANIWLYSEKYGTQIARYGDVIMRRFCNADGSLSYAFPLGDSGAARNAVSAMVALAAADGTPFSFSMISACEKEIIEEAFPGEFEFSECRSQADYIYLQEHLATLPGGKFHKKKNHISQFRRKYPDCEFRLLPEVPAADILAVADAWFSETGGDGDADKEYEGKIIRLAVENADRLRLFGGVLYAEGRPAAMTLASATTSDTVDIHFEKAVAPYARDGAYAVINKEFAAALSQFRHINREEDMGVEGLRKAKLSYYPDILLEKFRAERS